MEFLKTFVRELKKEKRKILYRIKYGMAWKILYYKDYGRFPDEHFKFVKDFFRNLCWNFRNRRGVFQVLSEGFWFNLTHYG